ncbi:MAG: hypothetical protein QXX41_02420 [Nitrososphaerota archaeon]
MDMARVMVIVDKDYDGKVWSYFISRNEEKTLSTLSAKPPFVCKKG